MSDAPAPVSPTGQPLVPARVVPYLLFILAVVGAVLVADLELPARVVTGLKLAEIALLAALGASPGLRRAAPLALLLLVLPMSGCAWWQRSEPRVVDCFSDACAQAAPGFAADLSHALSDSATVDVRLDALKAQTLARGGATLLDALGCALLAMVEEMSAGSAPPAMGWRPVEPDALQVRARIGRAWLDRQGLTLKRTVRGEP